METVYVALIAAIAAMMSPALLAFLSNNARRDEKREDYARQDKVAARAEKAASDLIASNKEVAEAARTAAIVTNGKLDVIHTLVNSNMTAAMQSELDAKLQNLALLREVSDLKKAAGENPSPEAQAVIAMTEQKIAELQAVLVDRLAQSKVADAQQKVAQQAASDATTNGE